MARFDFQDLVERLPLVVYVDKLDAKSSPLYISPQIAQLMGYSQEEWVADPDLFVNSIHPDDSERVLGDIADRNEGLTGSSAQFGDRVVFQFCESANGREALEACRAQPFDAAIIDIYLPIMDGAQVIAALRSDTELAAMPIIAVSAGGSPARDAALKAGADLFLDKPMRLRQVIESMRKLMELERKRAQS